ncbi:MAG: hypothetical protein F4Y26_00465 [Gammaproteobacteria bacterium]|nr:hypothetical protein [Gammaproteobacteria bacterium]
MADYAVVLQGMEYPTDEALEYSKTLTTLTADLGSFHNISEDRVNLALKGALTGEYESMKQFGIVLRAAEVDMRALNATGKKSVDNLTEQERVAARLQFIMERAGVAVGDAERTLGSFANQLKALQGEAVDVAGELGTHLLPLAKDLVNIARDAVKWIGDLDETTIKWGFALAGTAAAIGPVIWIAGELITSITSIAGASVTAATKLGILEVAMDGAAAGSLRLNAALKGTLLVSLGKVAIILAGVGGSIWAMYEFAKATAETSADYNNLMTVLEKMNQGTLPASKKGVMELTTEVREAEKAALDLRIAAILAGEATMRIPPGGFISIAAPDPSKILMDDEEIHAAAQRSMDAWNAGWASRPFTAPKNLEDAIKKTRPTFIEVPTEMANQFELAGEHSISSIEETESKFRENFQKMQRHASQLAYGLKSMFPDHTVMGKFADRLDDINSKLRSMLGIANGLIGMFNTIFGTDYGGGKGLLGILSGAGSGAAGAKAGAAATGAGAATGAAAGAGAGAIAIPSALPASTLAPAASIGGGGSTAAAAGGGSLASFAGPAAVFTLASLGAVKALGGNPGQIFDRNPFSNFGRGPSTEELIERERQRVRESGYGGIAGKVDTGWGGRTPPASLVLNVNAPVYGDSGIEDLGDTLLAYIKRNGG